VAGATAGRPRTAWTTNPSPEHLFDHVRPWCWWRAGAARGTAFPCGSRSRCLRPASDERACCPARECWVAKPVDVAADMRPGLLMWRQTPSGRRRGRVVYLPACGPAVVPGRGVDRRRPAVRLPGRSPWRPTPPSRGRLTRTVPGDLALPHRLRDRQGAGDGARDLVGLGERSERRAGDRAGVSGGPLAVVIVTALGRDALPDGGHDVGVVDPASCDVV
jgi:hypothetical protein